MLRLKLEYFETKPDESGYSIEVNRQDLLDVVVEDAKDSDRLVDVLTRFLRPHVELAKTLATKADV
jgi:hypothetical protein